MSDSYYQQKIYIPQVDEHDNFIGSIERWEAHEKGTLHRAFTIAVSYQDKIICQHRKHPVFDGWIDLTASSHPQILKDKIQDIEDAVIQTLKREWNLDEQKLTNLKSIGSIVYSTPDPNSKYIEHELCHFYTAETSTLPVFNTQISYGFSLQALISLKKRVNPIYQALAPWVREAFEKELF